jgi:hypothetical protein
MWWFEIGHFPPSFDAEEPEWMIQVVEWCKSYLAFCCDPPLLGYSIDGIATEEEIAQGTSVSGEVPWGMASNSRQPVKASIHRAFPLVFS